MRWPWLQNSGAIEGSGVIKCLLDSRLKGQSLEARRLVGLDPCCHPWRRGKTDLAGRWEGSKFRPFWGQMTVLGNQNGWRDREREESGAGLRVSSLHDRKHGNTIADGHVSPKSGTGFPDDLALHTDQQLLLEDFYAF